MGWIQWGEMFGPFMPDGVEWVTAFEGLASRDYKQRNATLPLHLRYRGKYEAWHLPEHRAVYAQINFLEDDPERPFEEAFVPELFQLVDRHPVEILILDLRYNGGGDGTMAPALFKEIVKREETVGRPGSLFVLTGRKTFSAALSVLDLLLDHTNARVVGEPPAARVNNYGDATATRLPHSGMGLLCSERYWQFSTSDDRRQHFPVHYPAAFRSTDYFAGRDPAIEAILGGAARRSLPGIIREAGGAAARREYESQRQANGDPDWWQPFGLREMRKTGEALLADRRVEDALVAFQLNAERHPDSWRVWEGLGAVHRAAGRYDEALTFYRGALGVDPDNWNGRPQREAVAALCAELPGC